MRFGLRIGVYCFWFNFGHFGTNYSYRFRLFILSKYVPLAPVTTDLYSFVIFFQPPGMIVRPGVPPPGVRLPPGPPPGRPTLRMPPGPPPGIPPVRLGAIPTGARPPPMPRPLLGPVSTGVVSAGPQLIQKEAKVVATSASPAPTNASVIESKPKIRNLLNDVTR